MSRNAAIQGEDSRPAVQAVYCYAVRDNGGGGVMFLANWDQDIEISGLPAKWGGSDPQTFTGASISHGPIEKQNGLQSSDFRLQAQIHDAQAYSRYLIFGMIPKIEVGVIKVSAGAAQAGDTAEWGVDTMLAHSGIVTDLTIQQYAIQVECRPEPMLASHQVPRWRFTRTCNHPLYSTECGVDPDAFNFGNAIVSINAANRQLTVSGQKAGVDPSYWRQGVLVHQASGVRLTILNAEHTGGNTVVQLHQWSPDLEVTDNVTLRAGCDHTIRTCENRFSNQANFGGFPLVPNKNITIHGAD